MEKPKKTMIFTISRMNPPTSGHMSLIKLMMKVNSELPPTDLGRGKVYVILSHKQDNIKNPLSCDRKRYYLETMGMIEKTKRDNEDLRNIQVILICGKDKTDDECEENYKNNPTARFNNFILDQLCNIDKNDPGITHAQLIVGGDREESYGFLNNWFSKRNIKLNENEETNKYIASLLVRPEVDPSLMYSYIHDDTVPIPIEHMSGTLMRELIKNDKLNKFQTVMQQTGLSQMASEELFDELKYNMPVQQTKRRKVKGGKKRKTNNKRRTHKIGTHKIGTHKRGKCNNRKKTKNRKYYTRK